MCACVLAFELLQGGKPIAWMYTHRFAAATALYSPLSKRERYTLLQVFLISK
jgi:hypothetical protein